MQITVPVLYIAFNRPEITEITFNKIREAQPLKLYVTIDGPRDGIQGEDKLVESVIAIVKNVDWNCEVLYKINNTNKGAEITISDGVSWVLSREEYVIVLEDDIVAPVSFFRFAEEMLIKYNNNQNIGVVSASNFTPLNIPGEPDYFFSKYAHSGGGWATWKRVWQSYDFHIQVRKEHLSMKYLRKISNSRREAMYYRRKFSTMKKKGVGKSSWDRVGNYINRVNNMINIVPRTNLTSNIGVFGLHANGQTENHFREYDSEFKVLRHPDHIELNVEYDVYHFNNYICRTRKTLLKRIFAHIRRMMINK